MKKSYHIIWTERAEKDLHAIVSYIARNHPSNALNILRKIKNGTSRLDHSPIRGRMIPELREQGVLQYRELIITPWRVMYRISGESVYVLAVLDARQNIEDILLERLLNT